MALALFSGFGRGLGFYGRDLQGTIRSSNSRKEVTTMKQILVDVLKELGRIFISPKKPKYFKPKLCQCSKCGQVHYRAIAE
jgi:hypothetical protein